MHRTFLENLRESAARAQVGWVNTFREEEFAALFAATGLPLVVCEIWHMAQGDDPCSCRRRHSTVTAHGGMQDC